MQTPVDDFDIFNEVSLMLFPHRTSCKGQAPGWVPPWIAHGPSLCASGSSRWPLPDHTPPSSLLSFWPNRYRSRSLRYTVVATPQTLLVWSRETTSPTTKVCASTEW
jgi:hypothetical protein